MKAGPARRGRRVVLSAAGSGMALVLSVVPAGVAAADPPTAFGWWTSANPGVPAGTVPTVVPGGGPAGVPSDIPAGGFEVANVPGDTSYAAFDYARPGLEAARLVLVEDPSAATIGGARLEACPITGPAFTPAAGGPLTDGPAYDCARSVAGTADTSSGTLSFAVGSLVRDGHLSVVIIDTGGGRTVFEPPGPSTVQPVSPVPGAGASDRAGQTGVDPSALPGPAPAVVAAGGAVPAPALPGPPVPAAVPGPALAAAPEAAGPGSPAAPTDTGGHAGPALLGQVTVTEPPNTDGVGGAGVGAGLVVLGAVVTWLRSRWPLRGRPGEDPGTAPGV